ncbi:MAG: hypothetical protein GX434_09855 [Peptococcaceae bacterium]|nr:hypothetical protein [Peptococcaceae bacterium]
MKIWNKSLFIFAVLCIVLSLALSGCGADKTQKGTAGQTPASSNENKKVPDDKEVVTQLIQKGKNIQEMTYTMVKNIKTGAGSVPSDTFTLPQGIQVMDLNALMQNSGTKKP